MKLAQLSPALPPPTPAEWLATDEVMLTLCETGQSGELLHFWEPTDTCVVVGYGNRIGTEVRVAECGRRGVPVHRRSSGGGTVVQLPGGLNYSLVLRIQPDGPTRSISAANHYIMERTRAALQPLAPADSEVSVRGHTDLCLGNRKFSGNAQRRQREFLLFHGTFLINCELAVISELLPMPSLQPDYREGRTHADFLGNFPASPEAVRQALARAWEADDEPFPLPRPLVSQLAREKYSTPEWNRKF